MRDLKSNIDVMPSLLPAARAVAGTGSGVDLLGYNGALAEWSIGAWTIGTYTMKLQESDVDTDGSYTDVGTADLQGSFTAVSGTAGTGVVQRVGYVGGKRYVRMMQAGTGTTGLLCAGHIVRGHSARKPLA